MPKVPKMSKIDVFYRLYLKKCLAYYYVHLLISGFACCQYQLPIIKTERSDANILGNLGILAHFSAF